MQHRWEEIYRQKLCSADDCAKLLRDGDFIFASLANGQPQAIGQAIAKRMREDGLRDLAYVAGLDIKWMDFFSPELQDRISISSGFVGEATRRGVQQGIYSYCPNRLWQSIEIVRDYLTELNKGAAVCVVAPMDEHGYFSTGCDADLSWGAAHMGLFKHVIVEVNENMPRTFGNNHINEISAICENHTPLVELPIIPITREDEMIGQYIADLIDDGACIQIGIGGMPNAVAKYLKDKKDLGVHSEMLTDSMVDLYYDGAINNTKKNINPYKMIGSFALGTKKLYDFINNNPGVEMHCTSYVNDPYVIGQNDNLISVNGTVEVDVAGQAASESMGYAQYSGPGGQLDFVQGAWRSKGGKSFLTFYSTYTDKEGRLRSTITPTLSTGMFVTTARPEVDYIVTEYGVAHLKGWDMR
jgi:acyl-CoA hydrolase